LKLFRKFKIEKLTILSTLYFIKSLVTPLFLAPLVCSSKIYFFEIIQKFKIQKSTILSKLYYIKSLVTPLFLAPLVCSSKNDFFKLFENLKSRNQLCLLKSYRNHKVRWKIRSFVLRLPYAKNINLTLATLLIYSHFNKCINSPLNLIRKVIKTFIATKEFLQFDRRFESFSSKH
jgi:hypothetical protein